jgi:hypothetical protein
MDLLCKLRQCKETGPSPIPLRNGSTGVRLSLSCTLQKTKLLRSCGRLQQTNTISTLRKYMLRLKSFLLTDDFASERMFKRRIQKWKLDKNNKQHEMQAIVHLAKQRRLDGRSPLRVLRLGRRHISVSEVERYFRRRGIREPDQQLGQHIASSNRNDYDGTQANQTAMFPRLPSPEKSSVLKEPVANFDLPLEPVGHSQTSHRDEQFLASFFPPEMIYRPFSLTGEEMTAEAVIGHTQQFYAGWCDHPPLEANKTGGLRILMLPSIALRFEQCMLNLRCGSNVTA